MCRHIEWTQTFKFKFEFAQIIFYEFNKTKKKTKPTTNVGKRERAEKSPRTPVSLADQEFMQMMRTIFQNILNL